MAISDKLPNKRRMLVKITKETHPCWYNKGEVHEVGCYFSFNYGGGMKTSRLPFFEKWRHGHGILSSDCKIIAFLDGKGKRIKILK